MKFLMRVFKWHSRPAFIMLCSVHLVACGGRPDPLHISEYIAQNNSSYTLEIIHFGNCLKGTLIATPGNRVMPYSQFTEPGTFHEQLARSSIPPDSADFPGVAAFLVDGTAERQLVGYWKRPFGSLFHYDGEEEIDSDTHHRYVMSIDDVDLNFSLRIPYNYYWIKNASGKDLSLATKMRGLFAPLPGGAVAGITVRPGEKAVLAKISSRVYSYECPIFEPENPFYVFGDFVVTVKNFDREGYQKNFYHYLSDKHFLLENLVDPNDGVSDFHHTLTITDTMVNR